MRIVDDDDESAGAEEEEEEVDDGEEDAEGVRFPLPTAILLFDRSRLDSQKRTNWSPTRNQNCQPPSHRGSRSNSSFLSPPRRWRHLVTLHEV